MKDEGKSSFGERKFGSRSKEGETNKESITKEDRKEKAGGGRTRVSGNREEFE